MASTMTTGTLVPTWRVGDRLRKAREMTGLTVAEMATRLGVDVRTLGRYERADEVRSMVIASYALATGVSSEWLATGTIPVSPNGGDEQAERASCCTLTFPAQRPQLQILVAA